MDQFVCVRLVRANGLDLSLFQFDYDLTFAVFLMNADRTVYGRYGSRSDAAHAERDISIEGFRAALEAALDLHREYPANRVALAGKQGRPTRFRTPDGYPSLRGRYLPDLDYEGKVVQSCLHCHQVGEAERTWWREAKEPMPEPVIYPWPMPQAIGLELDPGGKARVHRVVPGSPAAQAGCQPGDELISLEGQPLLSIADVQWVLHHAPAPATLEARLQRGSRFLEVTLRLPADWRRRSDISWRATTWDLRRMVTGGLRLREATEAVRQRAGLGPEQMGLLVQHAGEYGEHGAAKRAGFRRDDLIVAVAGKTERLTESQLIGWLLQNQSAGASIPATVWREGERLQLALPMQ